MRTKGRSSYARVEDRVILMTKETTPRTQARDHRSKVTGHTSEGLSELREHLKLPAPDGFATGAIAEGVAGLDHEALDHTVENQAIVVAVTRVHGKVLHSLRTFCAEEPARR